GRRRRGAGVRAADVHGDARAARGAGRPRRREGVVRLTEVMWHDLECGGYVEDLPLWRELAGDGPVLDLGCGTGRVALDLAAHGVPVVGLDVNEILLE